MKAKINDDCIGCGLCASIAGSIFRMNDEEKAEVYGEIAEENRDAAQEAADACPVSAIELDG